MRRRGLVLAVAFALTGCVGREMTLTKQPAEPAPAPPPPPAALNEPQPVGPPAPVIPPVPPDPRIERARLCPPAEAAASLPMERPTGVAREVEHPDLAFVRQAAATGCQSCHLAPGAASGGFAYLDQLRGKEVVANGQAVFAPGWAEAAAKMRASVAAGRMPPRDVRAANPGLYDEMATRLARWEEGGHPPTATVSGNDSDDPVRGAMDMAAFTEIGDCIPKPEAMGVDLERDLFFELAITLPPNLDATDLSTFDALALARRGTVSYNVEYPLWSDNSGKARHVHVPVRAEGSAFARHPARYDVANRTFSIPENTRFYKTFFKAARTAAGDVVQRPIETRLIVVRHPPRTPLFGTYVWNADATKAELLTNPYRDGTSWKDLVLDVVVDERTGAKRTYPVPGRHRCVECHMGGDGESFVLGFTPLQINRRAFGEAGRDKPTGAHELDQPERLAAYGVIESVTPDRALPRLEQYPGDRFVTDHALRAQGYVIGNCAHCHTPSGFAMKTHGVELELTPGALFKFNTHSKSKKFSNKYLVSHDGNLDRSHLYFRFGAPAQQLGLLAPMPLHAAGGPDCRGLTLLARWIMTFDTARTPEEIAAYMPTFPCTPEDPLRSGSYPWIVQDFTSGSGGEYTPRRADWASPENGMPQSYRDLTLDAGMERLATKEVAVDFFEAKPECKFPTDAVPDGERRPWMLVDPRGAQDGPLKQPLQQLYKATPGAWYYRLICANCHGDRGKGDGPQAASLAHWSGGEIIVASFMDGMFARGGDNLRYFGDLAGQYFIWMAMEGTRINVPPDAAPYLGKHKAQMLKQVKDRCKRLVPTAPDRMQPHFNDYEIYRDVCLYQNLPLDTPSLQYDPETDEPVDAAALDAWADKGARNAGWAIFRYLKDAGAADAWLPTQKECEKVYP